MHLPRAVDREPDEKLVLAEERGPRKIEEGSVGLDRVLGSLSGLEVVLGELDCAPKEVEPHQRRLTSLPGDRHLGDRVVSLDQLAQVRIEQIVRHAKARAWV